ncbi:hypothetical protein ACP70R_031583 [Stipagrostis hirtigluma subsp. patula]
MVRGLKKHLKRLNAPKHWMLDKLGGAFAPKPSSGPHKSRLPALDPFHQEQAQICDDVPGGDLHLDAALCAG